MVVWLRREDDGAVPIGGSEGRMLRAHEREVDQSVVDELDHLAVNQKPTLLIAKLARVGDHGIDARLQKYPPREHEFGIEVLLLGPVVDDGDPLDGAAIRPETCAKRLVRNHRPWPHPGPVRSPRSRLAEPGPVAH